MTGSLSVEAAVHQVKEGPAMTEKQGPCPGPYDALLDWLAGHDIEYELHEHPLTFTARETADAEHVDPRTFAKTVAITTDDGLSVLAVVEATDQVHLERAAEYLEADRVRLLSEDELVRLAPACEVGALPPIGELFGVEVIADVAIREWPQITFNAGCHRFSVRVDRAAWEAAAGVRYTRLAVSEFRPAWVR